MKHKLAGFTILALVTTLISFVTMTKSANTAPNLANNYYPHWRASISETNCSGPQDGSGNAWYEADFDDSQWAFVSLPAINDIGAGEDRFYRTIFTAPASGKTYLHLASDDGIQVYVNESLVVDEGNGCHQPGCVGDTPWTCGSNTPFAPLDISTYLAPGQESVIAVHVSNEQVDISTSYFFLSLHPENQDPVSLDPRPLIFELPFQYLGREISFRYGYYFNLQTRLVALFDHGYATEDILQPFIDDSFSNLDASSCQDGINCFDSNLAWSFISSFPPKPIYPVAEGMIISEKSGNPPGDEFGYRVCIQHGNSGYSTLYYNLDDAGLVTSGPIYRDDPIGYMGLVEGTTQYQMNLATFYDPLSNCTIGKQVDPSGWSSVSSMDPYQSATGLFSSHLWAHPFSGSTTVLTDKSNLLLWEDLITSVQFASGTYSETLHATLAPAPDPTLPNYFVSPGSTFYFVGTDTSGAKVSQVDTPMQIDTEYDPSAFGDIFPGSLGIYQFDASTQEWNLLPTTLGTITATATTQMIAPFAIMGEKPYTLTLETQGNGSATPSIEGPYHYEDEVELTAVPDPLWFFSGWSGDLITTTNPVTITIDGNKAITANFQEALIMYLPIIFKSP